MVRVKERLGVMNGHSLDDAFQSFLNARSADGVRERTKQDYKSHWRYFTDFLSMKHSDVKTIEDLSPDLIREYVNYNNLTRFNMMMNLTARIILKDFQPQQLILGFGL